MNIKFTKMRTIIQWHIIVIWITAMSIGFYDFEKYGILVFLGMIMMATSIPIAMIFGRSYCGWMCPMGSVMDRVISKISRGKPTSKILLSNSARLIALIVVFGVIAMFAITYGALEVGPLKLPPLLVGMMGMMVLAITLGIVFTHRTWCAHLCPIGTIITAFSGISKYGIYRTEDCIECDKCKSIYSLETKTWNVDDKRASGVDCMRCLDCVDICPKDAIELGNIA